MTGSASSTRFVLRKCVIGGSSITPHCPQINVPSQPSALLIRAYPDPDWRDVEGLYHRNYASR